MVTQFNSNLEVHITNAVIYCVYAVIYCVYGKVPCIYYHCLSLLQVGLREG